MERQATKLTERFSETFAFALVAHTGQTRNGTDIPYISHPMAVAALVLGHGGTEDQAMAALLHDTVEDCAGVTHKVIASVFGQAVSRIVEDCTDSDPASKPPWMVRKEGYIAHVRLTAGADSLLVSAADKLHNATAIVRDIRQHGAVVWDRFKPEPHEIAWYYDGLLHAFHSRAGDAAPGFSGLVNQLAKAVSEIQSLSKHPAGI